jgi:hypothetical protein
MVKGAMPGVDGRQGGDFGRAVRRLVHLSDTSSEANIKVAARSDRRRYLLHLWVESPP